MPAPGNDHDEPPPFLEVPGPCDLACAWCNLAGVEAVPQGADLDRISGRLENLAREGARAVGFGYRHSEPTTHPALPELVRRARDLGFDSVVLATSGLEIARRDRLAALVDAGLTEVTLTFPTTRPDLGDLLLARPGATEAKLRALDACLAAGLGGSLVLLLLRPALRLLPEDAARLAALVTGSSPQIHLQGCLMDEVPGIEPGRRELLWPRLGEVVWAVDRARAAVPGLEVAARDLPEEHAGLAGWLRDPKAGPGPAGRARRGGRPPPVAAREPPPTDLDGLRLALAGSGGSGGPGGRPAGPLPRWQRETLARVAPLASGLGSLAGFTARSVRREADLIALTMAGAGETVDVLVEDARQAPRSFVSGARYAVSYRATGREPTEAAVRLLHALLALLERARGGSTELP